MRGLSNLLQYYSIRYVLVILVCLCLIFNNLIF